MAGIVALWFVAAVAAFKNARVYRRAVAPSVVLPLGRMQNCALLRQEVAGVDAFTPAGSRRNIAATAARQCAVLAAFASTSRRAGRLVAQARSRQASGARSRKQTEGRAQLIETLRRTRKSAEIMQLLKKSFLV